MVSIQKDSFLAMIEKRSRIICRSFTTVGWSQTLGNLWRYGSAKRSASLDSNRTGSLYLCRTKVSPYPLYGRIGSSDWEVFIQIFVNQEYRCVEDIQDPELIIDCGANVGYASLYFLTRFPRTHIIAIEPDRANFDTLATNLKPFADRVRLLCAGIWSHKTGLVIERGALKHGNEWSYQVRECVGDEPADVSATDIGTVLKESGYKNIDILKLDIEGSEKTVFSVGDRSWLGAVKNLVVETHGTQCEHAVATALADYTFDPSTSGEFTVYRGIVRR